MALRINDVVFKSLWGVKSNFIIFLSKYAQVSFLFIPTHSITTRMDKYFEREKFSHDLQYRTNLNVLGNGFN